MNNEKKSKVTGNLYHFFAVYNQHIKKEQRTGYNKNNLARIQQKYNKKKPVKISSLLHKSHHKKILFKT